MENLAQYLSTEQTELSSRTVRRMLKFSSRDEYLTYLSKKMSVVHAKQLVQESEELSFNHSNISDDDEVDSIENQQRPRSSGAYYNVQNGTIDEEQRYSFSSKYIDRTPSSSSLSSDMLITNMLPSHRTILETL